MAKGMIKYARGTIWMVRNNPNQYQHGVQSGTRPFLILSNNDRGDHCSAVEGLWCTSQRKPFMRVNVEFVNDRGEINTVLCNQHTTLNINSLSEYMGTLSSGKMREVEEGMLFACGMGQYIELEKNFNKLLQTIEENEDKKCRAFIEGQFDEITRLNLIITELQANLQKKLQSYERVDTTLEIRTSPASKSEQQPNSEKSTSDAPKSEESATTKQHKILNESGATKKRNSWTLETMRQFVEDRKTMTLSEVAAKYQISKASASQFYYKFKAQLGSDD